MTIFNELNGGTIYSKEAFEDLKTFLINVYPFTCRHLTDKEKDRMNILNMFT